MKQIRPATEISTTGFACITVIEITGSAPCQLGSKMLCSASSILSGTIGGGNLEHQALAQARTMLATGANASQIIRYTLAASLGQCCGGKVTLLIDSIANQPTSTWQEWLTGLYQNSMVISLVAKETQLDKICYSGSQLVIPQLESKLVKQIEAFANSMLERDSTRVHLASFGSDTHKIECCFEPRGHQQAVAVFGAGHVARALMPIIVELPISLYWIDGRKDQFQLYSGEQTGITTMCMPPEDAIADLPANNICLVMTHNHQLDFRLCRQLLPSDVCSWLGVIGSDIKNLRFRHMLSQCGLHDVLHKLHCPVGTKYKYLKSPQTIAITLAMTIADHLETSLQMRAENDLPT